MVQDHEGGGVMNVSDPPPPPRAMEVHPLWNNASKEDEFKKKTEICSSACIPFC